ncbi:hypothetical protein IJV57_04040 [Candidatus Saccharibacteria bacterium]|nr:hypothetical protein [Candidatus Saccharibacteria bacterium]
MANTTNFSALTEYSLTEFGNYVSGAVAAGTKATNDYTSGAVAAGTKATIRGVNTHTDDVIAQSQSDLKAYLTGQSASVIGEINTRSDQNTAKILKNQYLGKEPWIWVIFAILFAAAFAVVYFVVATPIAHTPMKVFLGACAGLIACLLVFMSPIANRQP